LRALVDGCTTMPRKTMLDNATVAAVGSHGSQPQEDGHDTNVPLFKACMNPNKDTKEDVTTDHDNPPDCTNVYIQFPGDAPFRRRIQYIQDPTDLNPRTNHSPHDLHHDDRLDETKVISSNHSLHRGDDVHIVVNRREDQQPLVQEDTLHDNHVGQAEIEATLTLMLPTTAANDETVKGNDIQAGPGAPVSSDCMDTSANMERKDDEATNVDTDDDAATTTVLQVHPQQISVAHENRVETDQHVGKQSSIYIYILSLICFGQS
jgi:hypothetical protein